MESHNKIYFTICTILVTIIIIRGYFALHNPAKVALRDEVGKTVTFEGIISDEPQTKDFLRTFTLETTGNEGNTGENDNFIRVGADRYGDYSYGDTVKVTGKLSMPRNFSGNGGRTFDFVNYLGKDGIYYEFKKAHVEVIKSDSASISKSLFLLKRKFLDNLGKVLGEPHLALAGGLVVGEKSALGKELINDFRRAGLIHIVVLSGYNITIVAAMIRRILSFLPRTIGIILGALGIVLFGILVGGGATVVRSCIMAIIALFGELLRRDYNVSRALFIAAALMLIQNPLILLYDPSFQLSFLATLGLILLSSPIEKHLGFITERLGIRGLVASTLATQVFVSPYIFYMMGQLSIVGIFVNIIVLPFIPLTMLLIFLSGAFGFISIHFFFFLSQVTGWGAHILLSYELLMVRTASHLPFAVISLPAFSFNIVCGIYFIYTAVYFYFKLLPKNSSQ